MGRFPLHTLSAEDLRVREDFLRDEILSRLKGVVTVLLGGSGGRGAISFAVSNGSRVMLSDFDVVVICRTPAFAYNLRQVRRLENSLSSGVKTDVSIAVLPAVILRLAPRTNFYRELRRSRILYGRDFRNRIRVQKISDVEPLDGISMCFNYLHQLLRLYPQLRVATTLELNRIKVVYKMRRSLLGSLNGLLVRLQAFEDGRADRPDLSVLTTRACLEETPTSGDLLAPRWENVWSLASEGALPDGTPERLMHQWFDVKEFLETLILSILRLNHADWPSGMESNNETHAGTPGALTQNLQFWLLAVGAGARPKVKSLLQNSSVKANAQLALWYLSTALGAEGVDQHVLENALLHRARIPLPTPPRIHLNPTFERVLPSISDTWRFASPALGF